MWSPLNLHWQRDPSIESDLLKLVKALTTGPPIAEIYGIVAEIIRLSSAFDFISLVDSSWQKERCGFFGKASPVEWIYCYSSSEQWNLSLWLWKLCCKPFFFAYKAAHHHPFLSGNNWWLFERSIFFCFLIFNGLRWFINSICYSVINYKWLLIWHVNLNRLLTQT